MRVNNRDKATTTCPNFILHFIHSYLSEVRGIESKPPVVTSFNGFLFCPQSVFNIEPKDIYRETVFGKVLAPLCNHVR